MHSFTYSGSAFTGFCASPVIPNFVAKKISLRFPVFWNLKNDVSERSAIQKVVHHIPFANEHF